MRFSFLKIALLCLLLTALLAVSCTQPANNTNGGAAGNVNTNTSQAGQPAGRPANAQPVADAPGYFQAGPDGAVSLSFTSPKDGETIQGNSVAPTFQITGYPVYMDAERKKGQHIHVILDNNPYEADYDPATPFAKFNNLTPGTHTLRAFPGREWHESIKQPGAFAFVTFNVGQASATDINKSAPLLTYSRPKGDYKVGDHPKGVMLDFYVTNATLGDNDYKVRYTLSKDGKTLKTETLTKWEPVWWPWSDIQPGQYKVLLELLDKNNKPVPFKVGNLDYNHTEGSFNVTQEGAPAPAGNANANTKAIPMH